MSATIHNRKFREGREHFNAKRFFQAHEVWEEIWLEIAEPEKTTLQGIIQIAAGFHHYCGANRDGACSLLTAGLVKLLRAPESYRGISLKNLREETRQWIVALQEVTAHEPEKLPEI
jgi:predicted metal-dependent hydrolase